MARNGTIRQEGYYHAPGRLEAAVAKQGEEIIILQQQTTGIRQDVATLSAHVERLLTRFEESRKTNWPLFGVAATFVPVFTGLLIFVIQAYISSATAPLNTSLTALSVRMQSAESDIKDISKKADASTSKDEQSSTDRAKLNFQIHELEVATSENRSMIRSYEAATREKLAEIETQFRAAGNVENLRRADELRWTALLYEKAFGQRFPGITVFYPSLDGPPPLSSTNGSK
jgi:uncharacterized coiled-coil protein SlyX